MRLLADVHVETASVTALRSDGQTVERVVDVATLGQTALDDEILATARDRNAVLLTNDTKDLADFVTANLGQDRTAQGCSWPTPRGTTAIRSGSSQRTTTNRECQTSPEAMSTATERAPRQSRPRSESTRRPGGSPRPNLGTERPTKTRSSLEDPSIGQILAHGE